MEKEMSLIAPRKSIYSRVVRKLKSFFIKKEKIVGQKSNKVANKETIARDLECLKLVVEGEVITRELDNMQKIRLISLCNERKAMINKKIDEANSRIERLTNMLNKIDDVEKK